MVAPILFKAADWSLSKLVIFSFVELISALPCLSIPSVCTVCADAANLSEFIVSSFKSGFCETATTIVVCELPVRYDCISRVNFELRNETATEPGRAWLFRNSSITIPSCISDLLIVFSSSKRVVLLPIFFDLSQPAKSQKQRFDTDHRDSVTFRAIFKMKRQCDLDDS